MKTQYSTLGYRIDLYFHKYKLAIEVDELGHSDRDFKDKIEREKSLEKKTEFVYSLELILKKKLSTFTAK